MLAQTATNEYLSVREISVKFGVNKETASRWVRANEFPNAIRLKRDWRVPISDVEAFVRRRTTVPSP